jgi:anti-sigma-K factor RskA
VENASPVVAAVDRWQAKWSPMSDYARRSAPLGQEPPAAEAGAGAGSQKASASAAWPNVSGWGSLAGVLGTLVTLAILYPVTKKFRRRVVAPGTAETS